MRALIPIGRPVRYSAGKAPIVASGRLNRMMNGVTRELNVSTIARYTIRIATPIEVNRPPNASFCCWVTPASRTSTVDGIWPAVTRPSISVWTAALTAPVLASAMSAVIDAAGEPSMRVIEPWASACSTVAISPSGTLATVPTGSVRSVSTDVTWSGSRRTTIAVVPSSSGSWTWVAVVP